MKHNLETRYTFWWYWWKLCDKMGWARMAHDLFVKRRIVAREYLNGTLVRIRHVDSNDLTPMLEELARKNREART